MGGVRFTVGMEMFERTAMPFAEKMEHWPLPSNRRFAKALMTLRNRGVADTLDVLDLCFDMVKADDKPLRKYLFTSIVANITGGSRTRRKKNRRANNKALARISPQLQAKMHNHVIR